VQVLELPQRSDALQVRVAVKLLPQSVLVTVRSTEMVTFAPSQLSTAVGGMKLQAVPHSTVRLLAQIICGGVVSTTVIVWLQVLELPHRSIAIQERVVLKALPLLTPLPQV
jgi:hypothetical protein